MDPLTRKVWFYRGVAAALAGLLALTVVRLLELRRQGGTFGAPHRTWTVDLAERGEIISAARTGDTDFSETYLDTPSRSVHLHAMGEGQHTPLHVHPRGDEVLVVAAGQAELRGASRRASLDAGSVVVNLAGTPHEVGNAAPRGFLFTVVFSVPRFAGNLYLRPQDVPATAPAPVLAALDAGVSWPVGLRMLEVHAPVELPRREGRALLLYVLSGEGTVNGWAVRPHVLVHVGAEPAAHVIPGSPSLTMLMSD